MHSRSSHSRDLSGPVVEALWKGKKIQAIKLLRQEQSLDLKEAKDAIDQYVQTHPALQRKMSLQQSEALRNLLLMVMIVFAFLIMYYYYFLSPR